MEQTEKNQECYPIPFVIRSGYTPKMHFILLALSAMFLSYSFYFGHNLIGRIFVFPLGLLSLYCWIYVGVLRRSFVKLTEEGILMRTIFGKRSVKWEEIANVQTYTTQKNLYIGIRTYQTLHGRKDSYMTALSEAYGGGYSLTIPLATFPNANAEKLYSTIFNASREKTQFTDKMAERLISMIEERKNEKEYADKKEKGKAGKKEKVKAGNPVKALFFALITAFAFGIIYGFCIYQFSIDLLLIPVLGMMGIFYVFEKNCPGKGRNIAVRLATGIICALQFFIAIMVFLLAINLQYAETNGALRTIADCSIYIIQHPGEFLRYYLYGAALFLIGTFYGYSTKTTRRIGKIFLRKRNGFTVKKEKRYTSIYLIDYAEFNEKEDKRVVSLAPNTCMIENTKTEIHAFYIPEELIKDMNIWPNKLERASVSGEIHYKLNLGGRTEPRPYGYLCTLTIGKNRQIELIQLETD